MSTGFKGLRVYSGLGLQNVTGLWLRKLGGLGLGRGRVGYGSVRIRKACMECSWLVDGL